LAALGGNVAKRVTTYGSWVSPLSAEAIAAGTTRLGAPWIDQGRVYWLEGRPKEGGRSVVVREGEELTPAPFNVRSRVHEYGGGAYAVADRTIYFVNFADQRIYRQEEGKAPEALTPEGALRYADLQVDLPRNRIVCVVEDHSAEGEAKNSLGAVSLTDGSVTTLAEGHDFYSSPVIGPGGRLAWLCWNHPNMPWDGTELHVVDAEKIAGGPGESIFQPEWSPSGVLHYVSDASGWWNLYRSGRRLFAIDAELGQPAWSLGERTYGFDGRGRVVAGLSVAGDVAVFVGASPTEPRAVVRLDLATGRSSVLARSTELRIDPGYVSEPRSIEFPTEGGLTAHGIYYPPKNKDFDGPAGEKPPLLVISHGGPTGASDTAFSASIQYWTSRGVAVLDVNYGGSTGYGREYRRRLNGQWGIVDVDDCVNGAKYLVASGEADGNRLAIRGGSAGGYTTLAALAFRDVFKAGASYYGVSDLGGLAEDTHKFESRYLDSLIGPYPARRDLYEARSPIHHVEGLNAPTIFFQGLEDKVVPPDQAERMVSALKAKGVDVEYIAFEGEQHGFRKAENIQRALEAELAFYAKAFRFTLPEPVRA
jgi:dipeptidyl aminopeptidase/acylaminoacyl peptidase